MVLIFVSERLFFETKINIAPDYYEITQRLRLMHLSAVGDNLESKDRMF